MKRLLLLLTCAIVLSTAAPLAAFPGPKPQGNGSDHKHRWFQFHKVHKEKQQREKQDSLHNFPKSVGWWHHGPGPAGAGAK
jgi:hypothetical protein